MTKELSVTYHAPKGDSKVVEMLGHTFYDGKAETITVDDRVEKVLRGNKHFECGDDKSPPHAKPGEGKGR